MFTISFQTTHGQLRVGAGLKVQTHIMRPAPFHTIGNRNQRQAFMTHGVDSTPET